jgi:hypothetical protein
MPLHELLVKPNREDFIVLRSRLSGLLTTAASERIENLTQRTKKFSEIVHPSILFLNAQPPEDPEFHGFAFRRKHPAP